MSSNRLSYDTCAYKTELKQSTAPLEYMMYDGKYNNSAKCRIEFGTVGGNGVSLYSGNLVDLESDLRGQTRLLSDCPSTMFQPSIDKELSKKLVNQPSCQMQYYPGMGERSMNKEIKEGFAASNQSDSLFFDIKLGLYDGINLIAPTENLNNIALLDLESVINKQVTSLYFVSYSVSIFSSSNILLNKNTISSDDIVNTGIKAGNAIKNAFMTIINKYQKESDNPNVKSFIEAQNVKLFIKDSYNAYKDNTEFKTFISDNKNQVAIKDFNTQLKFQPVILNFVTGETMVCDPIPNLNDVIIHCIGTTIGMILSNTINKTSNILTIINTGFKIINYIFQKNLVLIKATLNQINKAKIQCGIYILSIGSIIKYIDLNTAKSPTIFIDASNYVKNINDQDFFKFFSNNKDNLKTFKDTICSYIEGISASYSNRNKIPLPTQLTLTKNSLSEDLAQIFIHNITIFKTNPSIARVVTGIPSTLWNS